MLLLNSPWQAANVTMRVDGDALKYNTHQTQLSIHARGAVLASGAFVLQPLTLFLLNTLNFCLRQASSKNWEGVAGWLNQIKQSHWETTSHQWWTFSFSSTA